MTNHKPTCPYCGAEMIPQRESTGMTRGIDFMQCSKCAARSPEIRTLNGVWDGKQDAALAAAMQRYAEPNRVLTLDEVVAWGNAEARPVYIELNAPNGQARMNVGLYGGVTDVSIAAYTSAEDWQLMPQNRYGERYRFWLRRPTDEERANARWEE